MKKKENLKRGQKKIEGVIGHIVSDTIRGKVYQNRCNRKPTSTPRTFAWPWHRTPCSTSLKSGIKNQPAWERRMNQSHSIRRGKRKKKKMKQKHEVCERLGRSSNGGNKKKSFQNKQREKNNHSSDSGFSFVSAVVAAVVCASPLGTASS